MRIIFDANILLSFLLAPNHDGMLPWLVRTCLTSSDIVVLAPPELLQETVETAMTKPYFRGTIAPERLREFLDYLVDQVEVPPAWQGDIPSYSRDPKDDYLLVYGLALNVDYLVTGDRDLLVLGQVADLQVLSPARFAHILIEQGRT